MKKNSFRIDFLIGRGSRLPNILNKILVPSSPIVVPLVVSHKKQEEGQDVPGIIKTKELGIPAIYWNLVQMRTADMGVFGDLDEAAYRVGYMRKLGAFISQSYYRPNLIFMTGWNLVLDENFTRFFKDIPILNVHPHPLPDPNQPQDEIKAPDGTKIPVFRGTEVWVRAVEQKLPWSGVTIHQVIPGVYDVGPVVVREWLKVERSDIAESLRGKLNEVEDRIVPETLLKIAKGEIILSSKL